MMMCEELIIQSNKFNTTMLKSNLCDKSDAYIILKGTVTIPGQAADAPAHEVDRAKKQIIFKDCAPFTDCMSEINNTHLDNAKYLDVVIPMYKLFEYSSKNYSRASGSVGNLVEMSLQLQ